MKPLLALLLFLLFFTGCSSTPVETYPTTANEVASHYCMALKTLSPNEIKIYISKKRVKEVEVQLKKLPAEKKALYKKLACKEMTLTTTKEENIRVKIANSIAYTLVNEEGNWKVK